jgi:hypothetical protein
MIKELILHLGLHKTGTTSIQQSCAGNRDALQNLGETFKFNHAETELIQPEVNKLNVYLASSLGAGFCDDNPELLAVDCVWTDEQLNALVSVLPKLPEHFVKPVHEYLSNIAGLTYAQMKSVDYFTLSQYGHLVED